MSNVRIGVLPWKLIIMATFQIKIVMPSISMASPPLLCWAIHLPALSDLHTQWTNTNVPHIATPNIINYNILYSVSHFPAFWIEIINNWMSNLVGFLGAETRILYFYTREYCADIYSDHAVLSGESSLDWILYIQYRILE